MSLPYFIDTLNLTGSSPRELWRTASRVVASFGLTGKHNDHHALIQSFKNKNYKNFEARIKDPKFVAKKLAHLKALQEHYCAAHNEAIGAKSKGKQFYVPAQTAQFYKQKDKDAEQFAKRLIITNKQNNATIRLLDLHRENVRFRQMYAQICALQKRAVDLNYTYCMVTITLAGRYHPSPTTENSKWDGSSVIDGHERLNAEFSGLRKAQKYSTLKNGQNCFGITFTEPHKDGCEHRHQLLFTESKNRQEVERLYKAHHEGQVKFVWRDDLRNPTTQAQTYCVKYLIKNFATDSKTTGVLIDEISNATLESVHDWRRSNNIRGYNFFGVKGLRTMIHHFQKVSSWTNEHESSLAKAIRLMQDKSKKLSEIINQIRDSYAETLQNQYIVKLNRYGEEYRSLVGISPNAATMEREFLEGKAPFSIPARNWFYQVQVLKPTLTGSVANATVKVGESSARPLGCAFEDSSIKFAQVIERIPTSKAFATD